jgi:hypothetical protein
MVYIRLRAVGMAAPIVHERSVIYSVKPDAMASVPM